MILDKINIDRFLLLCFLQNGCLAREQRTSCPSYAIHDDVSENTPSSTDKDFDLRHFFVSLLQNFHHSRTF